MVGFLPSLCSLQALRLPAMANLLNMTVPASSPKFLEKSLGLSVDTIAYDLEDSVTPSRKSEARQSLRRFLEKGRPKGVKEVAVRINSVDSGFAMEDLVEVVSLALHGPVQEATMLFTRRTHKIHTSCEEAKRSC